MTSWRQEKRPVGRIERLPIDQLPSRVEAHNGLQLLDVRERSEWDVRHIPGTLFEAWHDIDDLPDGLDPRRPVAVLCSSGQRAAVAASLLARRGAEQVLHVVDGGVGRWAELGQPVTDG
jgi:rhodanese-related sulfurtransferase